MEMRRLSMMITTRMTNIVKKIVAKTARPAAHSVSRTLANQGLPQATRLTRLCGVDEVGLRHLSHESGEQ
jgi:hypothetical protein